MENIFEDAHFGKVYKTRDGRKALYQKDDKLGGLYHHWLITEDVHFACTNTGEQNMKMGHSPLDIVSEWKDEFAAEKQALIDKACKWMKDNFETQSEIADYSLTRERVRYCASKDFITVSEMIDRFRKTMEDE